VTTPPKNTSDQLISLIQKRITLLEPSVKGIRVHASRNCKELLWNPEASPCPETKYLAAASRSPLHELDNGFDSIFNQRSHSVQLKQKSAIASNSQCLQPKNQGVKRWKHQ
jgi:hypothetical protein